tara:strand:- start:138 stop:512 length:375 start_codon:yes stop_codon:yes gene_type:complete
LNTAASVYFSIKIDRMSVLPRCGRDAVSKSAFFSSFSNAKMRNRCRSGIKMLLSRALCCDLMESTRAFCHLHRHRRLHQSDSDEILMASRAQRIEILIMLDFGNALEMRFAMRCAASRECCMRL